jgi:3-methyl-2-oxobutanoate hydroxymethyltransferase
MPVRTTKLREMKQAGEPIPCMTAYDFPTARLLDAAGIPVILVGDSLGNVVLGHESTVPVTMDDMVHHTKAVVRGVTNALVVVDMPFMSYSVSVDEALRNAGRLLQEGGAHAVKLEGGRPVAATVRRMTDAGIPVMGHLGLTPQSVNQLGGYRVQGRTLSQAQQMLEDAEALEEAGAFAIVLETIPGPLAEVVTKRLRIPTIGIGAGPGCDGQIQVIHDVLGFSTRTPKHAKLYANLNEVIGAAMAAYAADVRDGRFPTAEHTVEIDDAVLRELLGGVEIDR